MRPLSIVLLAFAASLMACGVAGLVAWRRCGDGDECASQLAISVLGLAPAGLLFSIMLLLVAARLTAGVPGRLAVALAVGAAVLPLIAFTMEDLTRSAIAAALVSALAFSLLSRSGASADERIPDLREEITLIEQTRAMRIRRRERTPAPNIEMRTTALPTPQAEAAELERASALLEQAQALQQRADALAFAVPRPIHVRGDYVQPPDEERSTD